MAERLVVATPRQVSTDSGPDPVAARERTTPARRGSRAPSGGRRSGVGSVTPVTPKRSFRLPEVVLGVLLVAGCALAAVLWQRQANTTETFVVAARSIPRGAVITADDLGGAQIGGETMALIPGADASSLLGQVAVVEIAAGSPMSAALVSAEHPLAAGEALTSMALEPGQMPPDLAQNDHVRIVVTTASGGSGAAATTLLEAEAIVWSVELSQDGVATVVTVRGPLSLTSDVASAVSVRLARVEG